MGPMMITRPNNMTPILDCARAMRAWVKDPNLETRKALETAFADVDWVEPEIDPDSPDWLLADTIFEVGSRHMGLKTFEELDL